MGFCSVKFFCHFLLISLRRPPHQFSLRSNGAGQAPLCFIKGLPRTGAKRLVQGFIQPSWISLRFIIYPPKLERERRWVIIYSNTFLKKIQVKSPSHPRFVISEVRAPIRADSLSSNWFHIVLILFKTRFVRINRRPRVFV